MGGWEWSSYCCVLVTCILKFFSLLNSGMSAAWYPATTWTLGIYSTLGDALLSEVLNVQSKLSEENKNKSEAQGENKSEAEIGKRKKGT